MQPSNVFFNVFYWSSPSCTPTYTSLNPSPLSRVLNDAFNALFGLHWVCFSFLTLLFQNFQWFLFVISPGHPHTTRLPLPAMAYLDYCKGLNDAVRRVVWARVCFFLLDFLWSFFFSFPRSSPYNAPTGTCHNPSRLFQGPKRRGLTRRLGLSMFFFYFTFFVFWCFFFLVSLSHPQIMHLPVPVTSHLDYSKGPNDAVRHVVWGGVCFVFF